jgi:hypothetical protein
MYMGVKGMLPLGCLPLWGRERVSLIVSGKLIKIVTTKGFLKSKKISYVQRTK